MSSMLSNGIFMCIDDESYQLFNGPIIRLQSAHEALYQAHVETASSTIAIAHALHILSASGESRHAFNGLRIVINMHNRASKAMDHR